LGEKLGEKLGKIGKKIGRNSTFQPTYLQLTIPLSNHSNQLVTYLSPTMFCETHTTIRNCSISTRGTEKLAKGEKLGENLGKTWEKFHFPTNFSPTYLL